jgi:beta-galactosidase
VALTFSFAWNRYKALIARDVGNMIVRDRNHPSIVVWGARTNECPDDVALWTQTQRIAKSLDDSRQTSGAMVNPLWNSTIQQDFFSLNDYDWIRIHKLREPQLKPARTDYQGYLITEAVAEISGPFDWYKRSDPVFNQQQQAISHARVLSQVRSSPHYAGAINWVGMDYLSDSGQEDGMKRIGIFDQFRLPRLAAAPYRAHMAGDGGRESVLEPSFYWRFDGHFSVTTLVQDGALIWSNADTLKLLVDDQPFATLLPTKDPQFINLPYPPFVANFTKLSSSTEKLEIQAFLNGSMVNSRTHSANLNGITLACSVDFEKLPADGQAMTRVAFYLVS